MTDLFHKKAARVQKLLADNEDRQKDSQQEQDGSEIRSLELERLIEQGQDLIERRSAFESARDRAAQYYVTRPARPGVRAPAASSATAT
jgi:hypothetical protein